MSKHGLPRIFCPKCGKWFLRPGDLRSHMYGKHRKAMRSPEERARAALQAYHQERVANAAQKAGGA